jgi:hypothetical protein
LLLGHLLYALLIGAISFLAAALTEGGRPPPSSHSP